jgi:hypothetical protein
MGATQINNLEVADKNELLLYGNNDFNSCVNLEADPS